MPFNVTYRLLRVKKQTRRWPFLAVSELVTLSIICVCQQNDLNKVRVDLFQNRFWISPYNKVKASWCTACNQIERPFQQSTFSTREFLLNIDFWMWSNSQISQVFPGSLRTVVESSLHLSLLFSIGGATREWRLPCVLPSHLRVADQPNASRGRVFSDLCYCAFWAHLTNYLISCCPCRVRQIVSRTVFH